VARKIHLSKSHRNGFACRQQRVAASSPRKLALPRGPKSEIGHAEVLAFVRPDTLSGETTGPG
jgi:hypothetical protein